MSYKIEPIWQACCEQLKTILSDDIYDRWIAVIQPLSIEENNLQLAAANDFYKDWLEENYLPLIDKALILIGHEELTATLTVDVQRFDHATSNEKPAVEAPKKEQQVWFIRKYGSNVNLGNIQPEEVIPLETLRLGLRGDTLLDFYSLEEGNELDQVIEANGMNDQE